MSADLYQGFPNFKSRSSFFSFFYRKLAFVQVERAAKPKKADLEVLVDFNFEFRESLRRSRTYIFTGVLK